MESIALLYRQKKDGRYSMERLFEPLESLPNVNRVELPCELDSVWNFFKLLLFAIKIKERNIHITGDVHYMAFILFWKKVALTIHDLNHYEELTGIRKKLYSLIWFWLPIKMTSTIAVISPYTKKQLKQYFKCENKKIHVINNRFNEIQKKSPAKTNGKFNILVIGTRKNKNIEELLNSIQNIHIYHITIIGKLNDHTKQIIENKGISFSNYWDLNDDGLAIQYNSADVLFFASTKEGFGLPILEAQSVGLPVITSNTTAMPYVAGKGAILVNPNSSQEISNALEKFRLELPIREQFISEGYKNINRFNEKDFIKSYLELYKIYFN